MATPKTLLVANRGEIAVRIIRTANALGHRTISIHTSDDAASPHVSLADETRALSGAGVRGYLDIDEVVGVAKEAGAELVHPGYGFLAENADMAQACGAAGIGFVGPTPETLDLFGDKINARAAAASAGIPILAGSREPTSMDEAQAMLAEHGAIMIKAVAGGGGRGMRAVTDPAELEPAWTRCVSEATSSFGNGEVFVEQLVGRARHIEVQIIGDGSGQVVHLGERDCSIQRRNQKVLELAPAPFLETELRDQICDAATTLGRSIDYRSLGTVEFLLDVDSNQFWFIEVNPRIQVEHTITEQVTGLDVVELQLALEAGASLADLDLSEAPTSRGWALQARINAETIKADGTTLPSNGTISSLQLAAGPGVRVDSAAAAGMTVNPNYDPLLAKLITHRQRGSFQQAAAALHRALCESHVAGVETNLGFLRNLASHLASADEPATTNLIGEQLESLTAVGDHPLRVLPGARRPGAAPGQAGAQLDSDDPLAVLAFGQSDEAGHAATTQDQRLDLPPGILGVSTPLQGTVVTIEVAEGDQVANGQLVAVVEAMKMEHEVRAQAAGVVATVEASAGDTLWADQLLLTLAESADGGEAVLEKEEIDLDEIRPTLQEVLELRAKMMDEARPDDVERRRKTEQRTARENLADLIDEGTFVEYGPVALAAQRRRRTREDLIKRSPADGLLTGVASVNGDTYGDPTNRCAVMIYDYTVFAGTQGIRNHAKTDRIIDVATEGRMPFILYAEGGGGRPGDTDGGDFGSRTFSRFATMSGLVPMVGVVSGFCFAGNASLLGCCDVIIATKNANIGMGGPAMIEGGGLGIFRPEEIGPADVHVANGVIDVLVEDEAEATQVAKKYLSYFQGPLTEWEAHDQRHLRRAIPENRLRTYDVRQLIETMADVDSVLELREGFGHGIVTSLIRIEGKPVGVVANNPNHLGGAIDSDGADKGARFMTVCDAFDIPVLFLCDTPGIMVGPEVEKTALVRHANRMFLIGANLDVPIFTVIVRKAYGLGGIAMAGGSFKAPLFSVAWPTAEFGPMGLEGSVKLGFRAELAAIEDPEKRRERYDELVAKAYRSGQALNHATAFAVDDAIDPAETRHWLSNMLISLRPPPERTGKKRSAIDGW